MVFNFFKKDYSYYQKRGDRLFQEACYAEARHDYEEAFNLLKSDTPEDVAHYLTARISATGNQLALMNLQEAAHAFQSGNIAKAIEHAELALEQAEDVTIRGNAEDFIQKTTRPDSQEVPPAHGHSCNSCSGSHHATTATSESSTDFLSVSERYELLIQPLPGNLSQRYREMGERFAYAYIAVHDERIEEGYRIFRELSQETQSDILEYELAIIDFQAQRLSESEKRLNAALRINSGNPLCYLALVQLLIGTNRLPEAVTLLQHMIASGHLSDHALIMLGDVLQMMGDVEAALGNYIEALNIPSIAKTAAEKAIPVLDGLGRTEDAQALAKRYLKGCC